MTYQASSDLIKLFKKVKGKLIYNFWFSVFAVLIYVYPMYGESGRSFNLIFIVSEIALVITLGLVDRSRTRSTANAINITAIEVGVFEDHLIAKTSPIKVLFWVNKPALELRFNIREFARRQAVYPTKQIYDLDHKVWKLIAGETEVYIITDYFDIAFKEELENFLYWTDAPTAV